MQQRDRLASDPLRDPFRLEDPIGGNAQDLNRDNLLGRDPFEGRDHDPLDRHFGWNGVDPSDGGATAPLDGGISLLLAAGIGLGMKRARERKKANEQKNIENAE